MENRRLRIFSRPRIGSSPGLSFAFTCWKFWHLATIYCLSKNHEMRLSEASDHHSSISGYYFWQICNIQVELQKDLQTLPPWQIITAVSSKQKAHKRKLESDSLTFFFFPAFSLSNHYHCAWSLWFALLSSAGITHCQCFRMYSCLGFFCAYKDSCIFLISQVPVRHLILLTMQKHRRTLPISFFCLCSQSISPAHSNELKQKACALLKHNCPKYLGRNTQWVKYMSTFLKILGPSLIC